MMIKRIGQLSFFSIVFFLTCCIHQLSKAYTDLNISKQANIAIPLTSTEIDELMASSDAFVVLDDFANTFFPQAKGIILGFTTLGSNMSTITTRIQAGTNTASLTVFCGALTEINAFLITYNNSLSAGQISTLTSGVSTLLNGLTQCYTNLFVYISASATENTYHLSKFTIYLCSGWLTSIPNQGTNPQIELVPSKIVLANQIIPIDPVTLQPNTSLTTTLGGNLSVTGTSTFSSNVTLSTGLPLFVDRINPTSSTGTTTFANNIYSTNNLSIGGLTTSTGLGTFNGGVTVATGQTLSTNTIAATSGGLTSLTGNLSISGTSTFNNNVTLSTSQPLFVDKISATSTTGTTTFCNNIYSIKNLSVAGTSTFSAATTVAAGQILYTNTINPASGSTITMNSNLTLNGTINGLTPLSDTRIKTDVEKIDSQESLEKILALVPRRFKYLPEWAHHSISGCEEERGFIAQEVKEVLPELISINEQKAPNGEIMENFHRLDYQKMVVDLVGALQALHKEFTEYKAQTEKKIDELTVILSRKS